MQIRHAGRRRLAVTPLGLGLAALGRPGYLNVGHGEDLGADRSVPALRAQAHAVLDAAYAAGIRYVDAARSYGRAEEFLGAWLADRGIVPGQVTVASKWGYTYTADWRVDAATPEVKDHSPAALDRQLAESRAALGPHLALYQIHSATLETGVLTDRAVLARLAALQDEGVSVGFSVSGPAQADAVRQGLEAEVDGQAVFSAVQCTWNLLEPSAGPALAEAHDAGWLVVVKEAVANGRLTDRGGAGGNPAVRLLAAVAGRHGVGIDAVAIAAALAQPFADVVLSGAATREHLASNVAGAEVTLTASELADLGALAEDPDRYWSHRSGLPWQ